MDKVYPVVTHISRFPETLCAALPEEVFEYPFFNEGVTQTHHARRELRPLATVMPGEGTEKLSLSGLIFGVSHCGSTLLARMLGQLEKVRVVSESEAINGLLLAQVFHGLGEEEIIARLIRILSLYQQAVAPKQHLVLKLTSWNVYMIKLFLRAFPGVRWIFLDREEEQLLPSLEKSDGGFIDWWHHPVDELIQHFLGEGPPPTDKTAYLQAMVHGHRRHARAQEDDHARYFQYPDFIAQFPEIVHHFALPHTAEEISRAGELLKYDAKSLKPLVWKGGNASE
jgi:hypothetical protein